MDGGRSFGSPLRNREFRAVWTAEILSQLGDQLARVALAILVFTQTNSALLTALTYALTFAPSLLGGFVLSGLADRFPRRTVLVATDLIRATLAAAMALPGLPLPGLWACVAALSLAGAPFKAAQQALLPTLLGDQLAGGIALRQATTQVAQLAGFAAGGLLLATVDARLAMLLNAATFLASGLVILVGVRARPAALASIATSTGVAKPGKVRGIGVLFGLAAALGLYLVPEGLAAPYGQHIGVTALGIGILMAADPLGSIVGAWLSTKVRLPCTPGTTALLGAAGAAALVACGIGPGLAISAVLWAACGALSTAMLVQTQTLVAEIVPDHQLGRVSGRLSACMSSSQGIAVALGGVAAEAVGPVYAVAGAGVLAALIALAIATTWKFTRSRERESETDGVPHHSLPRMDAPSRHAISDLDSMTGDSNAGRRVPHLAQRLTPWVRSWRLWVLDRRVVAYVVAVNVLGIAVTAVLLVSADTPTSNQLLYAVALTGLGLIAAEATRYVETMRRQLSDTPHVNMSSVWIIAVALLTTPLLSAACTVILYAHMWWRMQRWTSGATVYRTVFNTVVMVLSAYGAAAAASALPPELDIVRPAHLLGVVAVILTFWAINSLVVLGVIAIAEHTLSPLRILGSWSDNTLELVTLCTGVMAATLMLWRPWMLALVLPMVHVLHSSSLRQALDETRSLDRETGLFTAQSWCGAAERALEKAERHSTSTAVVMIDLENLDRVNGLTSDDVVRAVADALRTEVRASDLVGRFGGDEFVVLLPETGHDVAANIGDRITAAIQGLRFPAIADAAPHASDLSLNVSVGVAGYPGAGHGLDVLLHAAEHARTAQRQIDTIERELQQYR